MADKATKTIRIKWIRSGIGFPYTQKRIVRSLGLRKLNQVVERPDTPQVRGIVAKVPHLLAIVEPPAVPAWTTIPEITVRPPEVAPEEKAEVAEEPSVGQDAAAQGGEAEPAPEEIETSEESKAKKHAAPAESKKAKSAKTVDKKSKKGAAGRQGKPEKTGKK